MEGVGVRVGAWEDCEDALALPLLLAQAEGTREGVRSGVREGDGLPPGSVGEGGALAQEVGV